MAERIPTIDFGGHVALRVPLPDIPKAYVIHEVDPASDTTQQARELVQRVEADASQHAASPIRHVGEMAVYSRMAS